MAATPSPCHTMAGLHFSQSDTLAEPPIDLTSFSPFLPSAITRHRLMQGWTMRKFEHLQNQIEETNSILLQISCTKEEAELFKPLLSLSRKVKKIFTDQHVLTLHLHQRPSEEKVVLPPLEKEENQHHKKFISSHSVHFPTPDTTKYVSSFQNILQQLYHAVEERRTHLNLYLHGIDCLFFSYLLQELYPYCLDNIKLRPNYALQLQIKKLNYEERQEALSLLKTSFAAHDTSKEELNEIKTVHFTKDKSSPRALDEQQNSPKTAFFSVSAALALFCVPLHELSEGEILENKIYSLASAFLAHRLQHLPAQKKPKKEKWDILWQEMTQYLTCIPSIEDKKMRKEIQKLTLLKRALEQNIFSPIGEIHPVQQTDLFQVKRSLFPSENLTPLISIWIDNLPLQIDAAANLQEDASLIFFRSLLRSLARSQGFYNTNDEALALTLRNIQENEIPNIKHPDPKFLLLMLQAGSFSFFSHAHHTILHITKSLSKKYKIKYMKPQRNPTCEFFSPAQGDFTTIQTVLYNVLQNENEKGEFVVKWKVSFSNKQWSYSIQIPSITLNGACTPKEQLEIYEGFFQ